MTRGPDPKLRLSLVVAMAKNGIIGQKGAMPWHLPPDLKHFKKLTLGKPCLMGRKTFQSILASLGKPLPGRRSLVLTRDPHWTAEGAEVVGSIDEARAIADVDELMVIGGGEIYAATLPIADRLYLTLIDLEPEGDTHFRYDPDDWCEAMRHDHAAEGGRPAFSFLTLDRKVPRQAP